ncbi:DnaJ domain-containing protein [Gongronella butleri]|nr:DnaJ domain-containing protein [Gongronella butleri]
MQSLFDVLKRDDTDYYEILGCVESSTPEQIKAEYKRLALLHHPDKHKGQETKYKAIKEAYDIVGDPEQRAKYDRWRQSGLQIPFEDYRLLSHHAQARKNDARDTSQQQPHTLKPTASDRLPRVTIQKQSLFGKPDMYTKFRNYQV